MSPRLAAVGPYKEIAPIAFASWLVGLTHSFELRQQEACKNGFLFWFSLEHGPKACTLREFCRKTRIVRHGPCVCLMSF